MINGQSLRQLKKYEITVASTCTLNRKEEIKYTLPMRQYHNTVDGNVTEVSEQISENYMRHKVFTEVKAKITISCDVTL